MDTVSPHESHSRPVDCVRSRASTAESRLNLKTAVERDRAAQEAERESLDEARSVSAWIRCVLRNGFIARILRRSTRATAVFRINRVI